MTRVNLNAPTPDMTDDLKSEITARLKVLTELIKRDSAMVQSEAGNALFERLFDAVQSTMQDISDSSADNAAE